MLTFMFIIGILLLLFGENTDDPTTDIIGFLLIIIAFICAMIQ